MNRPLKGYPLKHKFNGYFELGGNSSQEARNSTMIPLLHCAGDRVDPYLVHTNPTNANYAGIEPSGVLYPGSVVNKIAVDMYFAIPKTAYQTDGVTAVKFDECFVMNAFDDYKQESDTLAAAMSTLLELDFLTNHLEPLWTTSDLTNASLLDAEYEGLTTDQTHESVAFDKTAFQEEFFHGHLKGLLKKMTNGGLKSHVLMGERPYIFSTVFDVPGYVKRANANTFLSWLFHVPLEGTWEQFWHTEISSNPIRIGYEVRFNEFHDDFDNS